MGRGQTRRKLVTSALFTSGAAVLGVMLANLLTRGFSWVDSGALALIWAFFFWLLLLFFSDRVRFGRRH